MGLFSGLANWFAVALKSAFAVVGMAMLTEVVLQMVFSVQLSEWHLKIIAVLCCLFFTVLNVVSVKHTSRLQIVLVAAMLIVLGLFVISEARAIEVVRYNGKRRNTRSFTLSYGYEQRPVAATTPGQD